MIQIHEEAFEKNHLSRLIPRQQRHFDAAQNLWWIADEAETVLEEICPSFGSFLHAPKLFE